MQNRPKSEFLLVVSTAKVSDTLLVQCCKDMLCIQRYYSTDLGSWYLSSCCLWTVSNQIILICALTVWPFTPNNGPFIDVFFFFLGQLSFNPWDGVLSKSQQIGRLGKFVSCLAPAAVLTTFSHLNPVSASFWCSPPWLAQWHRGRVSHHLFALTSYWGFI